ncbi:MAG: TIGR04211 family SH3 domain-containing protein [Gammaproteobacteria bacterium]|nr:TIGR04211 family SH3 domain-containing protein [Gammaproteobacteria bacterium]
MKYKKEILVPRKLNIMPLVINGFCLMMLSFLAHAETVYVTDILHLGMHELPGSGAKVETLLSGQKLKVLEVTRTHSKVQTETGSTGWAKSAYLVKEKPARLQLEEFKQKNQRLTNNLKSVKNKIKNERVKLSELQQQAKLAIDTSKDQADNLERLQKENKQFREHMVTYKSSIPFSVFMPAIIICLVAGFIGCYFWLNYQNRKRHGGFLVR